MKIRLMIKLLGVAIFFQSVVIVLVLHIYIGDNYGETHNTNNNWHALTRMRLYDFKGIVSSASSAAAAAAAPKHGPPIEPGSIPVFYNLYVGQVNDSARVHEILDEQMALLRPEHKPFFVQSMGATRLEVPPAATLLGHRSLGTEMVTLHSLWQFCKNHPEVEKVVYLHSKGSSRNSPANDDLRRFLTRGALSQDCAVSSSSSSSSSGGGDNNTYYTCNVCSSRFSPVPHPHTSGNMWLARCDYVEKLIDPLRFEERMQHFTTNCTSNGRPSCDGRDRFSAEHWIHSHPTVKPCDLYADPSFTWDYDGVPANGDFEIQLAPAPRFDIVTYIKWKKCVNRGVQLQHRLDEYWGLYQQEPDESWWGWKTLKTDKSWLPDHNAAKQWKKRDVCWEPVLRNNTERLTPPPPPPPKSGNGPRATRDWKATPKPFVCPAGSRIEQGSTLDKGSIPTPAGNTKKRRVLIVATAPRTRRHVVALWTQMECFTEGIDHIVLAAPLWSKEVIKPIVEKVRAVIPRIQSGQVSLETRYFVNDRYDAGLWCDAIANLKIDAFDEFGLVNDSVFAMRPFTGIFDALSAKNVDLSSMSYSYTPKFFDGEDGPQHFWLESVFRGFTPEGIDTFRRHSCVPADHPFYCTDQRDNKACIVNNFEHDLASQYPCDKVYGIYPADTPPKFITAHNGHRTWIRNIAYWRSLVTEANFPIAKIKDHVRQRKLNSKLAQCTRYFDGKWLDSEVDLSLATPRHELKWSQLDPDIQLLAVKVMGLDKASWKQWRGLARVPFDKLTPRQQLFMSVSLDCGERLWNANLCGPVSQVE